MVRRDVASAWCCLVALKYIKILKTAPLCFSFVFFRFLMIFESFEVLRWCFLEVFCFRLRNCRYPAVATIVQAQIVSGASAAVVHFKTKRIKRVS